MLTYWIQKLSLAALSCIVCAERSQYRVLVSTMFEDLPVLGRRSETIYGSTYISRVCISLRTIP